MNTLVFFKKHLNRECNMAVTKSKLLTMKVTESEKQTLKWLAEEQQVTVADLIRSALLVLPIDSRNKVVIITKEPTKKIIKIVDPDLIFQINEINNRLNLIAQRLKSSEKINVLPFLISMEAHLAELVYAYQTP